MPTQIEQGKIPGRSLALAGGLWGAASAIFLGGLRFALGDEPRTGEEIPGDIAFLLVYLMPFGLSLVALRLNSPVPQVAIWLAGAILGILASLSSFSGVTLILLPAVFLLLLAAWRTSRSPEFRMAWPIFAVVSGVVVVGILSFLLLFTQEDSRCWVLVRSGGQEVWEERPYSNTISLGPNDLGSTCTSNIISPTEAVLSLGVWGIAALGLFLLLPRWKPTPRAMASA